MAVTNTLNPDDPPLPRPRQPGERALLDASQGRIVSRSGNCMVLITGA